MNTAILRSRLMGRLPMKVLLTVVAATSIAGCANQVTAATKGTHTTPAATTHTVSGTVTLTDPDTAAAGCVGLGGYSDISAGGQVTVTNQSQTVLGSTGLGAGVADATGTSCVYPFSFSNIPKASFYGLTLTHRGTLQYSYQDMVTNDWTVSMTLGS